MSMEVGGAEYGRGVINPAISRLIEPEFLPWTVFPVANEATHRRGRLSANGVTL